MRRFRSRIEVESYISMKSSTIAQKKVWLNQMFTVLLFLFLWLISMNNSGRWESTMQIWRFRKSSQYSIDPTSWWLVIGQHIHGRYEKNKAKFAHTSYCLCYVVSLIWSPWTEILYIQCLRINLTLHVSYRNKLLSRLDISHNFERKINFFQLQVIFL